MSNVLVTGAGSGIGLELAKQFASHGNSLVLTARSESDLKQIGTDISREYGVEVRIIAADLDQANGPEELVEVFQRENIRVDILVNNAGLGHQGKFWEVSLEQELEIISVNIRALVILTHGLLPAMVARGEGRILNTASIAGFMPAPLMAVYHASKAFVLSFTEALASELKDTGVTATALCPGATDTDFFPEANLTGATIFQKGNVMAPQEVAKIGYEATMRGERVVVAGGLNKAMVFSQRFLPEWLSSKMSETFYTDVKTEDRKREPGEIASQYEEKNAKVTDS